MFFNLKITYLHDYVKITSIKLKLTEDKFHARYLSDKIEKSKSNLVRAKNTITDLALANDFQYFFTLTFNPSYDRFDLDKLRRLWKVQLRYIREIYNIDLKYLIVPEQHKNGAWHFHRIFYKRYRKKFQIK